VAATPPGDRDLSNGPGKLCQALEIDMSFNGCRLLEDERLTLRAAPEAVRVATSVRIGISRGRELPYRFYDRWSTWVSRR
jgi:DNA-3-methyladenine glycosylase